MALWTNLETVSNSARTFKTQNVVFSRKQLNECSAMLATAQWMLCDIGNGAMNVLRYWQLHDDASEYTKFSIPTAQCILWPTAVRDGAKSVDVPKCEIFDWSNFHDFYIKKSLWEGDFWVKIQYNLKKLFRGSFEAAKFFTLFNIKKRWNMMRTLKCCWIYNKTKLCNRTDLVLYRGRWGELCANVFE